MHCLLNRHLLSEQISGAVLVRSFFYKISFELNMLSHLDFGSVLHKVLALNMQFAVGKTIFFSIKKKKKVTANEHQYPNNQPKRKL